MGVEGIEDRPLEEVHRELIETRKLLREAEIDRDGALKLVEAFFCLKGTR